MTTNSFNLGDTVTTSATTRGPSVFVGMDNQQLLNIWENLDQGERDYRDYRLRVEFELQQRMKAEGAKSIFHETLTCELKTPSPDYDWPKLRGLAELVPPAELAKGFTPAHEETVLVPDAWNMTKIKPLAKFGTAAAQLIQDAAIPKPPKLVIKRKE